MPLPAHLFTLHADQIDRLNSSLESILENIGFELRIDVLEAEDRDLHIRSGHCRLAGRPLIVIDPRMSPLERLALFIDALHSVDRHLDQIYLPPNIRELLDSTLQI